MSGSHIFGRGWKPIARRFNHIDPTLVWARDNPTVAQQCLQPPVWDAESCDASFFDRKSESLEGYCQWRKWPGVTATAGADKFLRDKTLSISSHVLSSPLTLAAFTSQSKIHRRLHFCCVGARAEAMIPFDFWKEYLLLSSAMLDENIAASIDFIGPDVRASKGKTTDKEVSLYTGSSIVLRWYFKGYLHDLLAKNLQVVDSWDAFVFFNPGFGHPHLKDGWRETLKQVLPLGRPMLITAHSEVDAKRDADLLQQTYGVAVTYQKNPFTSRISYQDPFQKAHLVSPNQYVAHVLVEDWV